MDDLIGPSTVSEIRPETALAWSPRRSRLRRLIAVSGVFGPPPLATDCTPPVTPQELHHQQALQQQLAVHRRFQLFLSDFTNGRPGRGAAGAASTAAELQAGAGMGAEFGVGGVRVGWVGVGTIDGLVPDGVAIVGLEYRHRPERSLPVTNNFFVPSVRGRVRQPRGARSPNGLPIPPTPFPPSSGPRPPLGQEASVMIRAVTLRGDASGGSRTRIVRTVSESGYLTRATAAADPRLAGVLARDYVGVAQASRAAVRWLAVPVPTLTLIVSLSDPVRTAAAELPADWVGGMAGGCEIVEMPARHGSLDFKLTPLGARTVLGVPLWELAGRFVSLEDLFEQAGRRLGEQVRETADWDGRFDLVEAFLVGRMAIGPLPTPVVAHAWARLSRADGRLAIGELAVAVGASRRYLSAKFRDEVGMTPKTAARLLRFADVRRRIAAQPARFADIAEVCGYYDQAHLNRDFRELAGTTPSDFVSRVSASLGRDGGAVPFVQDAPPAAL